MRDPHLGNEHTSKAFDDEFQRLIAEITRMGQSASRQLADAMRALRNNDDALADTVIAADADIDMMESQVSHDALRLLALRQPIARDLREIVAALRTAAAIERVGDYAANIAKRVRALKQLPTTTHGNDIQALGEQAGALFADVIEAWRDRDAEHAYTVWQQDAELDRRHNALFAGLLETMAAQPPQVPGCAHLMFIAKNLERIGDHATNIAEQLHFVVHGQPLAESRRKQDSTSSMT